MTTILLTNDDGVHSPGLAALRIALTPLGKCITVAPDRDNSAVSHSLTINRPLLVRKLDGEVYSVDGTPADCVALAMKKLLLQPPDLLVSGINLGPNLGDDISYSGTVSAAREGTIYGIPAIAISTDNTPTPDFTLASTVVFEVSRNVLERGLPANTLLNINVPQECSTPSFNVTKQGRRLWEGSIHDAIDPWGNTRYWIGGGTPIEETDPETDVHAFSNGKISLTPIQLDQTNYHFLKRFEKEWLKPSPLD